MSEQQVIKPLRRSPRSAESKAAETTGLAASPEPELKWNSIMEQVFESLISVEYSKVFFPSAGPEHAEPGCILLLIKPTRS